MLTKVAVLFTLLVKTLSPYSVFFIFLKEHQVVCQVMLSKTMDEVEAYISAVRMKRTDSSIATDKNNRFLNELFTGRGLLIAGFICTALSTMAIIWYFGIGDEAQVHTQAEAKILFKHRVDLVLSSVLLGFLLLSIVLAIAMIRDSFTTGMFLKMGFNYLKYLQMLQEHLENFINIFNCL